MKQYGGYDGEYGPEDTTYYSDESSNCDKGKDISKQSEVMKPPVGLESQVSAYDLSVWNIEFTLDSQDFEVFLVSNSG